MVAALEQGVDDVLSAKNVLHCVVVTPEKTALEASAQFIAVPLYDGELGIAPGRAPLIGRLGYGPLRLVEGGKTRRFYIDGGFVQIADNVVTILTGQAIEESQLDAEVAAERLSAARNRPANTDELFAIRDRLESQARAQLRMTAGRKPSH
jgi:F-type H+-transporting ATPase subunit epsilon